MSSAFSINLFMFSRNLLLAIFVVEIGFRRGCLRTISIRVQTFVLSLTHTIKRKNIIEFDLPWISPALIAPTMNPCFGLPFVAWALVNFFGDGVLLSGCSILLTEKRRSPSDWAWPLNRGGVTGAREGAPMLPVAASCVSITESSYANNVIYCYFNRTSDVVLTEKGIGTWCSSSLDIPCSKSDAGEECKFVGTVFGDSYIEGSPELLWCI